MSELFAEATVHLTPDLTGFVQQLKTDVKAAVERVEKTPSAKIKISPALTRDFVGNLRKQINLAVAQAQKGVRPVQIQAVLSDVSRRQIARELRSRTQTVGGIPTRGAAASPALGAQQQFTASQQRLLNTATAQGIPLLGKQAQAAGAATSASKRLAGGLSALRAQVTKLTPAEQALARARTQTLAAQIAPAGSAAQVGQLKAAQASLLTAQALAKQAGAQQTVNAAVLQAAPALQSQITALTSANAAIQQNSAALAKNEAAQARSARGHEQVRRGALSTGLSFLGIRGATLAASASFLAGAAAIAVFAKALQGATQFATQMNVFRATTSASATELDRVREAARALGADLTLPGVSAADAGESMVELAKAGLSVQDSIDGARGVLQLATAAAIDNAQAVELAANAINAFGLAGRDATHVADVFANAANAAQGSIVDIGIAFQQASAAGRQVGLTFEDTSEFLTVLARNGLKGSDAGTSLRTALIRLIKPTKQAQEELKALGVQVRDAQGNLRPDVFIQLAEATKSLSPAARDAKIALIGGQDAFRAITILGRQSIDDFIALRQELRKQGTAAELAAARAQGLQGALDGLSNTLSTLGLRVGKAFTPAIQGTVEGLTAFSAGLAESDQAAQLFGGGVQFLNTSLSALGQTLGAVSAVVVPVAGSLAALTNAIGVTNILAAVAAYKLLPAIFVRIRAAATVATVAIAAMGLSGLTARAAVLALASAFNIWAIAAAAAATGIFILITREQEGERATRHLTEATEGLVAAQEKLRTSAAASRDTQLGVSGAQLGVLEAQQREAQARATLNASSAGEGTFARTKLLLELKVATDNVAIAQNALGDAVKASNEAQDEQAQAVLNAASAHKTEVKALQEAADAARGGSLGFTPDPDRERGLNKLLGAELEKRAQKQREANTEESRGFARRLELLKSISAAVGKLPTDRAIDITVNAPDLKTVQQKLLQEFGTTGEKLRLALFNELTQLDTSPEVTAAILDLAKKLGITLVEGGHEGGRLGGEAVTDSLAGAIDAGAPKVLSAVDRLLAQIQASLGRSAGLDVQENLAIIASGATGAVLPVLQQKLAEARSREAKARAAIAASPVGETPTLRKQLRQAIADQTALIQQIRGINEQLASDAESAANDAEQKQNEIFENILKAMGIKRDARQRAIEDAAATEGSADDLTATRKLRKLVNLQIDRIQDRIRAARKEGLNVATLIAGLRVLEGIYRDLGREVISLQKTRQQEIQDRIAENNQLDIEFAQLTENRQAEVRARLREINRLKKLQDATKRGTVEYKRYRNLIEQQRKAINDITTATKNLGAALQFQFLTTQQGFAANLLGNLLPIGAIGNTVGGNLARGGAGPSGSAATPKILTGIDPKTGRPIHESGGPASFATAGTGAIAGPTRGQQSTELELLRQILQVLRGTHAQTKHPENKRSQRTNKAAMDGQGN